MQPATCPFFNAKLLLLESGAFISEQCFTVLVSLRALRKHNREIPGAFSRLCFEESVLKRMLFPSKKNILWLWRRLSWKAIDVHPQYFSTSQQS